MSAIVLVHGWGYDARLWDGVVAHLGPAINNIARVDFGFFGSAALPTLADGEPILAVGHSLGALWLLAHSPWRWARLLAINGFPRFVEGDGYAPAVAPRLLARMRSQFAREPDRVLADFHGRCGAPGPTATPDGARLAEGLGWLADWDGRAALAARAADVHALAGAHDAIVPPAMSVQAFAALPPGRLHFDAAPGHVLPLTRPALCAQWIARLATS